MGFNIQAKVLRALETGVFRKLGDTKETKVDVRFIFATNKNLYEEVEKGKFRKDLLFRINTFVINLPPLRERKDDIPLLIDYFLTNSQKGRRKKRFSREAIELLTAYEWPGNVRELASVIERALLLSSHDDEIVPDDLSEGIIRPVSSVKPPVKQQPGHTTLTLAKVEAEYIQNILRSVGGNKSKAARLLGISRRALYDKIGANIDEIDDISA
jgi:DNA-binding NtrC family response regulator